VPIQDFLNPKDCRDNAARCTELAKTAESPEQAKVFRDLAKQWLKLAADLERAQVLLNNKGGKYRH